METEEIFKAVDNKKFTDFETAIKNEIDDRLSKSDIMIKSKSDFEKVQDIKNTFAEINKKYSSKE